MTNKIGNQGFVGRVLRAVVGPRFGPLRTPYSHDLGFLKDLEHEMLAKEVTEVKRMLTVFIQKLMADR